MRLLACKQTQQSPPTASSTATISSSKPPAVVRLRNAGRIGPAISPLVSGPDSLPSVTKPLAASHTRFSIIIRQEPTQGRSIGFAQPKGRRFIDPPLILQLVQMDGDKPTKSGLDQIEPERFICFASLVSEDGTVDQSVITRTHYDHIHPHPTTDTLASLVGTTSATGMRLIDLDRSQGTFFVFSDLSVRIQGVFRLKCHLVNMDDWMTMASDVPTAVEVETVMTGPFTMHSPRNVPRKPPSSPLSRCFAAQGVPIHILN
ncbi:velvet factor-domain-containing protein [Entophlyctis helioformis]|nr:velvet factor-domain-containing protein [Entophlyctis helioformis]